MFVKRNRSRQAGKDYRSVLLVRGKRVPGKRKPGRPAAHSPPPKSVVVHETLANLSKLPEDLIDLIEQYCQEGKDRPRSAVAPPPEPAAEASAPGVHLGPIYGLLAGLHALAEELGIVQAVGQGRRIERLAL